MNLKKQSIKVYGLVFTFIIQYPSVFGLLLFLDYGILASILISSMFATHTLVSYPIVNSYGISKNEAVAITIGGTILTDTAVLIILAVITGASQGNIGQEFWVTLGVSFAIFLFIMFGVIPRIAKWFSNVLKVKKLLTIFLSYRLYFSRLFCLR